MIVMFVFLFVKGLEMKLNQKFKLEVNGTELDVDNFAIMDTPKEPRLIPMRACYQVSIDISEDDSKFLERISRQEAADPSAIVKMPCGEHVEIKSFITDDRGRLDTDSGKYDFYLKDDGLLIMPKVIKGTFDFI